MDKRLKATLAISAAFALCTAPLLGGSYNQTMTHTTAISPIHTQTITQAPPIAAQEAIPPTVAQETVAMDQQPADLWSDDNTRQQIKILDIPLDAETQWAIYEACGHDPSTYCFVAAIAEHESNFKLDLVGDNGQSLGMMQINTRWHTGRMEALGVTDLTDPAQCAAVAIDYLRELESRYGFEAESEALLMAYNMGPAGARVAQRKGIYSTDYSRTVFATYQDYLGK